MKKGLILFLCILPLVLFGQSYDRLSFTHKLTGKNYVLKPGDRVVLKGVYSSGKKFKQRGLISKFENNYIVLIDEYSYVPKEGQFISLSEIHQINIVNLTKLILLLIVSILASMILYSLFFQLLSKLSYFGLEIKSLPLKLIVVVVLGFFSYSLVNSGVKKIKNLKTEWAVEQINLP